MLKVSFKDKEVKQFNGGKVTIVTLKGEINIDPLDCLPNSVRIWMLRYINNNEGFSTNKYGFDLVINVTGKAVCSEEDTVDKVFGERLAEARAKKKLYRFMANLSKQLFRYYFKILYGFAGIDNYKENNLDCLESTIDKYEGLWERENGHAKTLINDQFNRQSTTKS